MNTFRNLVLTMAYAAFLAIVFISSTPPPPKPIQVVNLTEKQIKEQYIVENKNEHVKLLLVRGRLAARSVLSRNGCRRTDGLSILLGRAAYEQGISPRLLAAVVFVESSCNSKAVSGRDSIGLMQVNPRVWGHRQQLKDPEFNVRFGARILASYIHRFGIRGGLHHYNGLGNPTDDYAEKVLTAEAR
jgi:soluble lytic murein transglycosylase-like protein